MRRQARSAGNVAHCHLPESWSTVPGGVLGHIASFVPPNEVACSMRFICKHWTSALGHAGSIVHLSQSVPQRAFKRHWSMAAGNYKRFNREQKEKLVCLTAASGNLANLKVLIAMWPPTEAVLTAAAGAGQLGICKWLLSQGCEGDREGHIAAARGGHVHVVKWWGDAKVNGDVDASALEAARAGQFGVIDYYTAWGKRHGFIPKEPGRAHDLGWGSGQVLAAFVEGCPLHVAQQAYGRFLEAGGRGWVVPGRNGATKRLANLEEGNTKRLVTIAALASSTPDWRQKLAWLEGEGLCSVRGVGHVAARRVAGSGAQDAVERLQHLQHMLAAAAQQQQQGVANNAAAAEDNTESDSEDYDEPGVAWDLAMEMDMEMWDAGIMGHQGMDGGNGPIFNTSVLRAAAAKGDLRVVRYLFANGAPDDYGAMEVAAEGGHLDVVKLLDGRGGKVEVDPWILDKAAGKGRMEVVKWIVDKVLGLEYVQRTVGPALVRKAAAAGSGELVRWLRRREMPWDARAFVAAAGACSEETVRWMAKEDCPMGARGEAFAEAATVGDIPMLRTLLAVGCRWSETHSFAHCIYNCHVEGRCLALPALEWLLGQGLPVHVENAVAAARQRVEKGQPEELSEWVLAKWGRGVGEEVEWDEGEVSDGEAEYQEEYGDGGEEEEGESDEDEDEEGEGEDDCVIM